MRLLLLLVPALASADKIDPDAWYPRLSAGVAVGFRSGDLARTRTSGPGVSLLAEVKVRPALFVGAIYDYASGSTHEGPDVTIATQTVQVALRTPLMSFGGHPNELGGDMFVSAGIGREWNAWDGGALDREVLALGMGTTLILPHAHVAKHLRFGFRFVFARAPDPSKAAPGCEGPCDVATTTRPFDFSMVVEAACQLGR